MDVGILQRSARRMGSGRSKSDGERSITTLRDPYADRGPGPRLLASAPSNSAPREARTVREHERFSVAPRRYLMIRLGRPHQRVYNGRRPALAPQLCLLLQSSLTASAPVALLDFLRPV